MGMTEKGVAGGLATLDTNGTLTAGQMPAAYVNSGNASIGGTLAVTGAATLASTLAVTGATTLTGDATANGNLIVGTVTKGVKIKEGTNATMGTGTLNGATEVTIATTKVTATSRIFLTVQTPHGTPAWALGVSSRSVGVSFGVKGVASDTSDFAWVLIEPAP